MRRYVVVTEPPERDKQMAGRDKAALYRAMQSHDAMRARALSRWVEDNGLTDQITAIVAVGFHMLRVDGTEDAARLLEKAPGVVSVIGDAEFPAVLAADQPHPTEHARASASAASHRKRASAPHKTK